jgi:hypothetical protein
MYAESYGRTGRFSEAPVLEGVVQLGMGRLYRNMPAIKETIKTKAPGIYSAANTAKVKAVEKAKDAGTWLARFAEAKLPHKAYSIGKGVGKGVASVQE